MKNDDFWLYESIYTKVYTEKNISILRQQIQVNILKKVGINIFKRVKTQTLTYFDLRTKWLMLLSK